MKTRICNKNFLVKTLVELVQIPSLSGEEEKIAEKVSKILEDFGYQPKIDEYYNVITEIGSGKTILLNAHLDHVPPVGNWTIDPYSGKIVNGKVYGVGASDNKSGVAAMLEIARILSKNKPSKGKVLFLFTSREESEKAEARKALVGKVKADVGICLDHNIDAKNRVVDLIVGCKGIGNFEVEVYGKAYHSSEPEKGINAIYRAVKLVEAIQKQKFPVMKKPLKEKAVASITKINTDGWATRIPDLCKLTLNYRALPKEKKEKASKRISNFVKRILKKDFKVTLTTYHEGYLINLNNPIIKTAKKSAKELGFKLRISIAKGWVDAATFTNQLKIPTICMGPTTKGQAHIENEYEEIENLVNGTEIVLKTVLNYLKS